MEKHNNHMIWWNRPASQIFDNLLFFFNYNHMYRLQYYIFIKEIFVCCKAPKRCIGLKISGLIVISCAHILMGVGARVRNLTAVVCSQYCCAVCTFRIVGCCNKPAKSRFACTKTSAVFFLKNLKALQINLVKF